MLYIISFLVLMFLIWKIYYLQINNIVNYYLEKFPLFREADNVDDDILSDNIFVRKKR
jgi:hypothetical protein